MGSSTPPPPVHVYRRSFFNPSPTCQTFWHLTAPISSFRLIPTLVFAAERCYCTLDRSKSVEIISIDKLRQQFSFLTSNMYTLPGITWVDSIEILGVIIYHTNCRWEIMYTIRSKLALLYCTLRILWEQGMNEQAINTLFTFRTQYNAILHFLPLQITATNKSDQCQNSKFRIQNVSSFCLF